MREADLPRTIIETPNYRLVLENGTYSTFATLNLYGKQKDNFVNTYYVWVSVAHSRVGNEPSYDGFIRELITEGVLK